MGTCLKCGRGNGKASSDNSMCWECYSGRTDAYKKPPKMVGMVDAGAPKRISYNNETIKAKPLNGYIKKRWYRNGDLYSGYMQNSLRHGRGKLTKAETQYTYEGDWYMDYRHGHGEECLPGHWRFSGEFRNGKRHGFGKLYFYNGDRYEGDFADDERCGRGILYNAKQNSTYEGTWSGGKLNGFATEKRADGSVYEGSFADSRKIGEGKITEADGTVVYGHWDNDRFLVDRKISPAEVFENTAEGTPESTADLSKKEDAAKGESQQPRDAVSACESTAAPQPKERFQNVLKDRFVYFNRVFCGLDQNGVLHAVNTDKKGADLAAALDGLENIQSICAHENDTLIVLSKDGSVVLAESVLEKGLFADKGIKNALPTVRTWRGLTAAVCGGLQFVGLSKDGTVIGAGNDVLCNLKELSSWQNIVKIACTRYGTVGLCADGTVRCCGTGITKEMKEALSSWQNMKDISGCQDHFVGLSKNGTVVATGNNKSGQCNVESFKNIDAVVAGSQCTVAVSNEGKMMIAGAHKAADLKLDPIKGVACGTLNKIYTLDEGGALSGESYQAKYFEALLNKMSF